MDNQHLKWTRSAYLGEHEWVHRDTLPAELWDKYAEQIATHGYDMARSFFDKPPKTYRYWNHDGYRYWVVGDILNRAKNPNM